VRTVAANWTRVVASGALGLLLLVQPAGAQTAEAPPQGATLAAAAQTAVASGQVATLVFANRPIVEFRASVLSRTPAERASAANSVLNRLVDEHPNGLVATSALGDARLVTLDQRVVFAILPQDVDELTHETIDRKASEAVERLQLAFNEAVELRTPPRILRSVLRALGATVLFLAALWLLRRGYRASTRRLGQTAQRQIERLPGSEIIIHASRATKLVARASALAWLILAVLVTDAWLTFVLRQFPYTRPWGESLRQTAIGTFVSLGRMFVNALPGLFTVFVIVLITRLLVRLVTALFEAAGRDSVHIPGVYPETAQPTRRIVVALLWLFALVVSYSYLPGSDSDAFKGASVFVGLIVSLGSTGIMNQIMSGLTITYSRALRLGDFVKIGDVEGTVTHLGVLAMKVKTPYSVEITIPNAVVVSSETTNYSRYAEGEGVFVPTSVTIGYDAPWRQIHALLLAAAERTAGIRPEPQPEVRQTALQDFYVEYTLLVCLERPHLRSAVLNTLHANIQDAFNEAGVQIMSPHYESDPEGPKLVPRSRWHGVKPDPDPDQPETPRGKTKAAGAP
jgi:small-conductance mechanosensitive channel